MTFDPGQAAAGAVVGILVGLTGMGGGAVLTPALILLFGVDPTTAVSSDLLASLAMRPFGGLVHARRGTVSWRLVAWLSAGSVPAGFAAVLVLRVIGGGGSALEHDSRLAIGVALMVSVVALACRPLVVRRAPAPGGGEAGPDRLAGIQVRPLRTVAIGVVGGFMVGATSVGAGSLMMVLLLFSYPRLSARSLVGTDLVQAIPLIASATLGHAIFGGIEMNLTLSVLAGSVPAAYIGARLSSRAPDGAIRAVLAAVLAGTALVLIGVDILVTAWSAAAVAGGGAAWWLVRGRAKPPSPGAPSRDGTSGRGVPAPAGDHSGYT